ncbi:MAG: hypothetical protein HKN13_12425, partial [Rhodothermales bacterium]|nr:hypothetical protein [Rhodothermales bacterium]
MTPGKGSDAVRFHSGLVAGGLAVAAADRKLPLFEACVTRLRDQVSAEQSVGEQIAFFVPGRIEVLGKHTDYAGGDSLLCAVSHGFCFVIQPTASSSLTVINAATGEGVNIGTRENRGSRSFLGHWSNYPNTVWQRVRHNVSEDLRGGVVAFASDLPEAAGISSSSALVVGTFLAIDAVNGIVDSAGFRANVPSLEALGDYLGCVENGRDYPGMPGTAGVGTTGGSQDQTAILCARAGELQHFSFGPTKFNRSVPIFPGYTFVIAASGVRAEKTGDA